VLHMLELQCTCGWACRGETKQDLLEQAKVHAAGCPERGNEPLDEGLLRALIAQRARPVEEASPA
jgi:hypothetical protein